MKNSQIEHFLKTTGLGKSVIQFYLKNNKTRALPSSVMIINTFKIKYCDTWLELLMINLPQLFFPHINNPYIFSTQSVIQKDTNIF